MDIGLIIWLGIVGLTIAFALTMLLAARFEKQPVISFVPLKDGEAPQSSAYLSGMNEAAERLGFQPHEIRTHAKEGSGKAFASLWLSPSQHVLAVVGAGKVAGFKARKTVLYSWLADGNYVATTDEYGEAELPGLCSREALLNADFYELVDFHERRLAESGVAVVPFSAAAGWQEHAEMEVQRVRRLVEMGYAQFVDPAQTKWRYTLKGSFKLVWQWHARMRGLRKQRKRAKIKRPGHRRYVPSTTRGGARPTTGTPPIGQPSAVDPRLVQQSQSAPTGAAPAQGFFPQAPEALNQSGYGIASFILALTMWVVELGAIVGLGVAEPESSGANLASLVILTGLLGALVGFALGIAGVVQRYRKRLLAILGLVLNGLLLLLAAGLLILGMALAQAA